MEEIGSDPFSQLRSQAFVHVLTARGVNLYITMGGDRYWKIFRFSCDGDTDYGTILNSSAPQRSYTGADP